MVQVMASFGQGLMAPDVVVAELSWRRSPLFICTWFGSRG
jgi:hypothetical protein